MNDRALLVAMPLRHLESGRALCDERGSATLPAGAPGDLDEAPPGAPVLVIATEGGGEEVPAVTWRAVLVGRVVHADGDPWPAGVPWTWLEEHGSADTSEAVTPNDDDAPLPDEREDEDEDEDDDDDEVVGPQSFFEVRELAPVPRSGWIFANELVPKQQRGGRTFRPRTPRLIRFVD